MLVRRNLATVLVRVARQYPVVTVTGPRQSGKTTLCRRVFARKPHVNLERIDERDYASSDPKGFLGDHPDGAVLDEVQHAPDLLSYLQADVDDDPRPGRWVLTGSEHLGLSRSVPQTLAGRTGILDLLPLAIDELRRFRVPPSDLFSTLVAGGFPRIPRSTHSRRPLARPTTCRPTCSGTSADSSRSAISRRSPRSCDFSPGRTAWSSTIRPWARTPALRHNTARAWLSVLEASFLVFRVPAWASNPRKRLVKTAKLHWMDTGLAASCSVSALAEQSEAASTARRVFETWVAREIYKAHATRGSLRRLYHLRETRGGEVDLLVDRREGPPRRRVQVRRHGGVGRFRGLESSKGLGGGRRPVRRGVLVYGGSTRQRRYERRRRPLARREQGRLVRRISRALAEQGLPSAPLQFGSNLVRLLLGHVVIAHDPDGEERPL